MAGAAMMKCAASDKEISFDNASSSIEEGITGKQKEKTKDQKLEGL
jgi:hypothetical protein